MSEPKLTPWFDGSVKPARAGLYMRLSVHGFILYSWWNGKRWSFGIYDKQKAYRARGEVSMYQCREWCGLAEQPK